MLPRNSNSPVTGEESDGRPYDSTQRTTDQLVAEALRGEMNVNADLHYSIWCGFTILNGGVGYGYGRVFAGCLDEELTSVRVEDPYIRSDFQIQNFFRFCELLDQKCKNLKRVTLITADEGLKYEAKIKQKVELTLGDRLHFEYEEGLHDRKVDFDNGWRVKIDRGLDYFKPPEETEKSQNPSFGDADDMNHRTCKATTITILRGETNVNADLRHQSKIPADGMSSREESKKRDKEFRESKFLGEYTERVVIGRGEFDVVFKAQHKIDKGWYAIKQVDPVDAIDAVNVADTEQSPNKVLREVHILAKLDNPNIVRYYDAWMEKPPPGEKLPCMVDDNQPCLYIRMEWCSGSTLHDWLGQNRLPAQRPIAQTLDWFRQLASAIKHLHDKKAMHRDIKPGNIFFGSSRDGASSVLKIGGFGMATYAAASSSSSGGTRSLVGTPIYMSPEQPSGHYKNSTDIFSLGLVFLEMLHPFETDEKRRSTFGGLRANQRPKVMAKLDKNMDVLISWMTAFEPKKRLTASELDDDLKKMRPLHQSTVAGNCAISSGTEPAPSEGAKLQLEDAEAYDDFGITVDERSPEEVYAKWLTMSTKIYPNFTSPKGLALIINNMHFIRHKLRHGTEKDKENLKRLFDGLGYFVKVKENLTSSEIHEAIRKFGADERHSKCHSAIVAILSHGGRDVIFGRDSKPIDVNALFRQMNAVYSPLLKGKPKIFLIQACRGDLYDEGYTKTDGSSPTKKRSGGLLSSLRRAMRISIPSAKKSSSASRATSSSSSFEPVLLQPSEQRRSAEGDICILASTPSNYCSFRSNIHGSRFVQSVCKVFAKHAHDSDLIELMRLVHDHMDNNLFISSQQESTLVNDVASSVVYKQIPETVTRFSRRFFFYPGVIVRECDGVVLRQQKKDH